MYLESGIQDCLGFYLLKFMAINNANEIIIIIIIIIKITTILTKKESHWSYAKEPETPYKAQHRRYYLHKILN